MCWFVIAIALGDIPFGIGSLYKLTDLGLWSNSLEGWLKYGY